LTEVSAAFREGTLQVSEYAESLLAHIASTDQAIGAWAHLDPDAVRAAARRLDQVPAPLRGALHGIPVGLKDIIHTRTLPTRMGSRAFDTFAAPDDAACLKRLAAAGAYAFGKTVTTEIAFMHPGKTRNPWNAAHTPGGSSQGSAAAVAAGHVPLALGTQTNGSVIRPAAYCGVVGFKPTLGAIPFAGVNLFSETLDTLGTFTRTVADAVAASGALLDRFASEAALRSPPRLAFLPAFPWTVADCDADDVLEAAASRLRAAGADVVPVALPDALHVAARVHRVIMLSEAARNLNDVQQSSRPRLSHVLNAALDEGRAHSEHEYQRALAGRAAMIAAATDWLAHYDAVIAPSAPGGAPAGLASTGDPSCCTLASLLGAPALSLPVGLDAAHLPLGMQLFAAAGNDAKLLSVAAWCEARLPFPGLALPSERGRPPDSR
jgi:Asp-tRNA(Asn)/Glu-tRNA(Gln) amidotransferase A subunit family amidase